MDYKVCILAAGVGSRMGTVSDHINKAILPVNNKAAISYIVEKFPEDQEFVIAVGHKKDTVVDYLLLAYPSRKFTFVEVDKYSGPGTGPGYSILQCADSLQCPFIFFAADTIILEDVPPPEHNWMGIAPVKETEPYCTVKIKNNLIYQLDNKIKTDNRFAFIGLGGVHDYVDFFDALKKDQKGESGEIQVTTGFARLIEKRLVPIGFTWFDTGTLANYTDTNKSFSGGTQRFDFSKSDEFLYFVNNRVIKFFADESIARKRQERAKKALKGLSPEIEGHRGHFYSYAMVPGQTIYSALSPGVVTDFLAWAKAHLWKPVSLTAEQTKEFARATKDFYQAKTKKRLKTFHEKLDMKTEPAFINGISVPTAAELLDKVDWDHITRGTPTNFHGDLQFDNVLVSKDATTGQPTFVLLDWRHDFGGMTDAGDVYYDLAKLYGGMTLSYPLIKEGMFSSDVSGQHANYHYFIKSDLADAREQYERFLIENGYDLAKVKVLTALIFLNMAPLHNDPFDTMLHSLGRNMLHKALAA